MHYKSSYRYPYPYGTIAFTPPYREGISLYPLNLGAKLAFLEQEVQRQQEEIDNLSYRLRRIEQQLGYSFRKKR